MRCVVWVGLLVGIVAGLGPSSEAQIRTRFQLPAESPTTPEINRKVQKGMDDAKQLILDKQFRQAVVRLQDVLDDPEDYFLENVFRAKTGALVGVRAQAISLLADLPAEGQAAYESHAGITARELLKQGMATNDLAKIALVGSRYAMTAAGFDAIQFLAASAIDHGQPAEAALLLDTLIRHPRATGGLKGPLLLQSAAAWHLAGQSERSQGALEQLLAIKPPLPWRIGGKIMDPIQEIPNTSEWYNTHFGPPIYSRLSVVNTWSLPRGGATGNESAAVAYPVGGGLWNLSPRKYLRLVTNPEINRERIEAFDQVIRGVERTLRNNQRLTQPVMIPLVIGEIVVYRTLNDVSAVSLRTGELLWRSSTTDGMLTWLFQSPLATEGMQTLSPATFSGYFRFKLFHDQLSGSLTSDGTQVYAIEESESQFNLWMARSRMPFGPQMIEPTNKLVAYELSGGRLLWEVGGANGTPPVELSGHFFLGPPLPSAGRLYCLAEAKNELRLISLIPEGDSVRWEWSQPLVSTAGEPVYPARRAGGLIPAISDGIAICPTSSGTVVAFDLNQRQLRWGYSYESLSRRNQQLGDFLGDNEEGHWLSSGPLLADHHVILTPRDSNELHCLSLIEGKLIWKRPRDQGLYVACVSDGHVVVVGRTQVTAYSLAEGSEVWNDPISIPEPAGRGVRIGDKYLLPLSTGEIASIDLKTGRLLGRSLLPDGQMPGNLAAAGGTLVSYGTHELIGFRSLDDLQQQIARPLQENSVDAESLALRGELKLHQGEPEAAIQDLRKSIQQRPEASVKQILAAALLHRLQHDPTGLITSAAELESLTDDPRQRIDFLRLYAKSLATTGDRVGAVTQLLRLSKTTSVSSEPLKISSTHSLSREQELRSQLFSLDEGATVEEKLAIRQVLSTAWEGAFAGPDRPQRLARLSKLTIGHPTVNPYLLRLAESNEGLLDESAKIRLLERLSRSQDSSIAAPALAALASHFLEKNLRADAQSSIQDLITNYPAVVCREGKTGRQIYDEWRSRGEILPANEGHRWPEGFIDVERTEQNVIPLAWPVEVVTRVGRDFEGWSFEIETPTSSLVARDPAMKIAWRLPLEIAPDFFRNSFSQLHIRGRRLALTVGFSLIVLEATSVTTPPQKRFQLSLQPNSLSASPATEIQFERRQLPNGRRIQLLADQRGSIGFLIGMSDDVVCYQLDNRLYAVDFETGSFLWSRTGSVFSKSNATVDDSIMLNTSNNGALILRTLDGTPLQQHQGNPHDTPLWFRGTRRLSYRTTPPDQRVFEMRDFDGDRVVWQSQHPTGSLWHVINEEELAVLTPSGKLTMITLATGEPRLVTELQGKRSQQGAGLLLVQRWEDRYLIIAGVTAKNTEKRRVTALNQGAMREFGVPGGIKPTTGIEAITVDGEICSISQQDGTLQWTLPVTDLAYDPTQPANLPVVVLASLVSDIDRFTGFPQPPRISALVVDKRSGRTVYETLESVSGPSRSIQFNPQRDEGKLMIDFSHWQLDLTFPKPR